MRECRSDFDVTFEFAHGNKMPSVKTPKEVPAATAAKLLVT